MVMAKKKMVRFGDLPVRTMFIAGGNLYQRLNNHKEKDNTVCFNSYCEGCTAQNYEIPLENVQNEELKKNLDG